MKVIKEIKSKESSDGITIKLLEEALKITKIKTALQLLNESLNTGIFPETWKKSTVIPVPKVQHKMKIEAFRLVNTLPKYEQLLEHIVKK